MKLLLTSRGISNETIKNKFFEMVGMAPQDITLAYIPTAVNASSSPNKRWMIDNIIRLDEMGIGNIDIVDFSAIPKNLWQPRLERANVIFVEGGTPSHLLSEIKKAGLDKSLVSFNDKVYVGCSAGSNILGEVVIKSSKDTPEGYKSEQGLGLVNFSIRPHYLRPDRVQFNDEMISEFASKYKSDFYAIDDDSAIVVQDDNIDVVSEGKWKKFNQ